MPNIKVKKYKKLNKKQYNSKKVSTKSWYNDTI